MRADYFGNVYEKELCQSGIFADIKTFFTYAVNNQHIQTIKVILYGKVCFYGNNNRLSYRRSNFSGDYFNYYNKNDKGQKKRKKQLRM